jgi:hypothetical protein
VFEHSVFGHRGRLPSGTAPEEFSKNNGAGMFKLMSSGAIAFMSISALLVPLAISEVASGRPAAPVKADRLDVDWPSAKCGRPFYDTGCLYGGSGGVLDTHKVHIIIIGRSRDHDQPAAPKLQTPHLPKQLERCASLPPSCWSSKGIHAMRAIRGYPDMSAASEVGRV